MKNIDINGYIGTVDLKKFLEKILISMKMAT